MKVSDEDLLKKEYRSSHVVRQRARRRDPLPEKVIKIRRPKPVPDSPRQQKLLTMLPMAIMVLGSGAISFFLVNQHRGTLFTIFGTVLPMLLMALTMIGAQQLVHRRSLKEHQAKIDQINAVYAMHLREVGDELDSYASIQSRILTSESPPFRELEQRVVQKSPTLWERQPTDDDFLAVRVGTTALPHCATVKVPDEDDDPRVAKAEQIAQENALVMGLPLTVNLNSLGSVGVQGRRSEALYSTFLMVSNIVVHQSPDEVKIYIFSHRPNAADLWGWARWIPHTNALQGGLENQSRLSFRPGTDEPVMLALFQELRQRSDRRLNQGGDFGQPKPHIVAIFDHVPSLQGHKMLGLLLNHDPNHDDNILQACAIFVDHPLPPRVSAVLTVQENEIDYRETWAAGANQVHFIGKVERTNAREMEQLARRLAPLHTEKGLSAGLRNLPSNVRLVELLGATNPQKVNLNRLYSSNYDPRKVMKFPVGLDTNLKPLSIILRETGQGGYGAHAMLTGMTGTGKSVLLQAMVLSMALTNPPVHLNFVLADFKDDVSELAKLKDLPHVVGFVTDSTETRVERFCVAMESEVLRRKVLFDTAIKTVGAPVANIRTYNELFSDDPLPHLVVLLDEFAHGLHINPNLRKVMDTIAVQGRALGIHLILSTRRVADFDNKIRPNVDVRMSLRVASREDSKTLFNREEAFSQLTRPGQAYLQVGDNEIFEMFQAARADIPYMADGTKNIRLLDEFAIYEVASDGRRQMLYKHDYQKTAGIGQEESSTFSEAEMLVERIQQYCADHFAPSRIICFPPLPEPEDFPLLPLLDSLPVFVRWQHGLWSNQEDYEQRLTVPIGLLDLPAKQAQEPYIIDLKERDGNYTVIDSKGSGKALFLSSLVLGLSLSHRPDDLHLYIISCGPALTVFENLPHCGGVIQTSETERIMRLLEFLNNTIKKRRQQMSDARVSSMNALRRAHTDDMLPAIVVLFEDFAGFKANHEDKAMEVQRLIGDVKAIDIHLIIASTSINAIHTRIWDNLQNRAVFGLESSISYVDVLGKRAPRLGEINGRGYTVIDQEILEFQIAAPARKSTVRSNSQASTEELAEIVESMRRAWKGHQPQQIEELPAHISLEQLWQRCPPPSLYLEPVAAAVGLVFDDLEPAIIDFGRMEPVAIVSGPPESGKTELLVSLVLSTARQLSTDQVEIIILAPKRNNLSRLKPLPHVQYAHTASQCEETLTTLAQQLTDRAQEYRQSQVQIAASNISQTQQLPKHTLIFIDDLQRLLRHDALPALVDKCYAAGQETGINIVIADTGKNLRQVKNQAFNICFIQAAFKMGCCVVFSTDPNDLTLLGLQFKLKKPVLKLHESKIGRGRAFFTYQGRESVVQFATVAGKNTDEEEYRTHLDACLNEIRSQTYREQDPDIEEQESADTTKNAQLFLPVDATVPDLPLNKTTVENDMPIDVAKLEDSS